MVSSLLDAELSSEDSDRSSAAQWQRVEPLAAFDPNAAQDGSQRTREELEHETNTAKLAVAALDRAVAAATSFREPATELVSEAHRALNRLEQARLLKVSPELIVVACEIKCHAKKGLTLVNVHGGYGMLGKLVTLVARSTITLKFDKISSALRSQLPTAGDAQRAAEASVQSSAIYTGTELREATHEKIHAITYVPDHHTPGHVCIWWSAGRQLEFYTDTSQSITTCFTSEKSALLVTSIAIDAYGQIWTGHLKGVVRVRKKQQWDCVIEHKFFNHAVKCIAFDATGCAWMGDEAGYIRVVRCDDMQMESLEQVASVHTTVSMQHAAPSGGVESASLFAMMTRTFWPGTGSTEPEPCEGPVRCILIRDNSVWIGGGKCEPWLGCWDAGSYLEKEMCVDLKAYGVPHCMTQIPWGVGTQTLQWSNSHTSWRLLTGHEHGQVLMWNPISKLQPLLVIEGSYGIRGLSFLESCNLILTGHGTGHLVLFAPPAADVAITGNETGGSVPHVKPRKATITAHKSAVAFVACQGASAVSASMNGTVKLWQVPKLLKEAERQGLVVYTGTATADISLATTQEHSLPISEGSGARSGGVETSGGSGVLTAFDRSTLPVDNIISASELKLQKVIGNGAYGRVWLAEWGGTRVAVKEVGHTGRAEAGSFPLGSASHPASGPGSKRDNLEQALNNEVHMLASLTHPNIVRFCAVCVDPPLIVMQYYPHGSLYDLLKKARIGQKAVSELTWMKRLDMLRDVAAGMQFLHKRSKVHGDLRSPNLLLDYMVERGQARFHIRIADFGLARALSPQADNVAVSKHTNPRWAAPELIKQSQLSRPSDVYSFGVVMWELLTWQQPYEDMKSVQVIFSATQLHKRPEVPPDDQLPGAPGSTLPEYTQLMEICWADDPDWRPSFGQILEAVDHMREQECKPPTQRKFTRTQSIERVKALTIAQPGSPPFTDEPRQRRASADVLYSVDPAPPAPPPRSQSYNPYPSDPAPPPPPPPPPRTQSYTPTSTGLPVQGNVDSTTAWGIPTPTKIPSMSANATNLSWMLGGTNTSTSASTHSSVFGPQRPVMSGSTPGPTSAPKPSTASSIFASNRPSASSLPDPASHTSPPRKETSPFLQQNVSGIPFMRPQKETSPFPQQNASGRIPMSTHKETSPFLQQNAPGRIPMSPQKETSPFTQQNTSGRMPMAPQKETSPFTQQNTSGIPLMPLTTASPAMPATPRNLPQSPYMWGGSSVTGGTSVGGGYAAGGPYGGTTGSSQHAVGAHAPLPTSTRTGSLPATPPRVSSNEGWNPFEPKTYSPPYSSPSPSSPPEAPPFPPPHIAQSHQSNNRPSPHIIPTPHHTNSLPSFPSSSSSSVEQPPHNNVTHWPTTSSNPFANLRPLVPTQSVDAMSGSNLPHTNSLPNMAAPYSQHPVTTEAPLIRLDSDPPLTLEEAARILQRQQAEERMPPAAVSQPTSARTTPVRPARQQLMSPFAMPAMQDPTL